MGTSAIPVFAQSVVSADYLCSVVLNVCEKPSFTVYKAEDYVDRLLNQKPEVIKDNNYINNLYKQIQGQENRKKIKILHISDVHLDYLYTVGTLADCNMPLCCREENGFTNDRNKMAKEWGSYKCDMPYKTFLNMLEFVREEINPDLMVWTGDNSPHNVWNNTAEESIFYTVNISMAIK